MGWSLQRGPRVFGCSYIHALGWMCIKYLLLLVQCHDNNQSLLIVNK